MKRYGLVFMIDDQFWLAEYSDGTIEEAMMIIDDEGVYADLNPREMSLVTIEGEGQVSLHDVKMITIQNDEDPDKTVADLWKEGDFSLVAESIYEKEVGPLV